MWGNIFYGFIGRAEGFGGGLLQWAAEAQGGSINSPGNYIERAMGISMYDDYSHTPSVADMNAAIRRRLGGFRRYCDAQAFPWNRMSGRNCKW